MNARSATAVCLALIAAMAAEDMSSAATLRITDPNGVGLPGALVERRQATGSRFGVTAADGTVDLGAITADTLVTVSLEGFREVLTSLQPGAENLAVTLTPVRGPAPFWVPRPTASPPVEYLLADVSVAVRCGELADCGSIVLRGDGRSRITPRSRSLLISDSPAPLAGVAPEPTPTVELTLPEGDLVKVLDAVYRFGFFDLRQHNPETPRVTATTRADGSVLIQEDAAIRIAGDLLPASVEIRIGDFVHRVEVAPGVFVPGFGELVTTVHEIATSATLSPQLPD